MILFKLNSIIIREISISIKLNILFELIINTSIIIVKLIKEGISFLISKFFV